MQKTFTSLAHQTVDSVLLYIRYIDCEGAITRARQIGKNASRRCGDISPSSQRDSGQAIKRICAAGRGIVLQG